MPKKTEVIILHEGNMPQEFLDGEEMENEKLKCSTVLVRTCKFNFVIDPGAPYQMDDVGIGIETVLSEDEPLDFMTYTHLHHDHVSSFEQYKKAGIQVIDPRRKDTKSFFGPNIETIDTSGHLSGHKSFLIKNATVKKIVKGKLKKLGDYKKVVFSGDAVINQQYLETNNVWVSEKHGRAVRDMHKLYELADFIIPGHGPAFKKEDVVLKIHNLTSQEYIDLISSTKPTEDGKTMTRYRFFWDIKDYKTHIGRKMGRNELLKRDENNYCADIKRFGLPKPDVRPGMRVLDLGCGYCFAMLDLIEVACAGYCTNEKCMRGPKGEPYNFFSPKVYVGSRCDAMYRPAEGEPKVRCNHPIEMGRVVGVDLSEEALRKGEKHLRNKLDNRFVVIRASDNKMENIETLKKYGVDEATERRKMSSLDRKLNRKVIPLYQKSVTDMISLPLNYFDLIVSDYMMIYVEEIIEALLQILQSLKVGGKAYIIGSHPFYIMDKEISAEDWRKLILHVTRESKTVSSYVKPRGLAKRYTPASFYEEFFSGYTRVTVGKSEMSILVEKKEEIPQEDFDQLYDTFIQPLEPWPDTIPTDQREKMAIRCKDRYRLETFYQKK